MFILNRIVLVLNGLAILALLGSYAAPYISPEIYWPIAFLGIAYPVLVGIHILFILYWIAVFKMKFLYSLIALGIGYKFFPAYIQFKPKKTVETNNSITILDLNMKYLGAFEKAKSKSQDEFLSLVDEINPTILCFQEFKDFGTKVEHGAFTKLFKRLKSYNSVNTITKPEGKQNGMEMVIFSKFPIVYSGIAEHQEETANYTVFADILINGDTVRVISTHLQSIKFDAPDYTAMKNIKLPDDSTVNAFTNITRKLKRGFVKRAKQSEALRDFMDDTPYPIILTGDFNDSPSSYAYRMVKGNLEDAFMESGSGLGRTYVGAMPSFRIDYIMHDPKFESFNYRAYAFEFTDHKMLVTSIKLK